MRTLKEKEYIVGLIKLYGIAILIVGIIAIILLPFISWIVGKINKHNFKQNIYTSILISITTAIFFFYLFWCWVISTFFICSAPPQYCHYPTFYDNLMLFIPYFLHGLAFYIITLGIIILIVIKKKNNNN